MKVLIITHSLRYNYGGILQNFALQQVLKRMGHQPVTLKLRRKISRLDFILDSLKHVVHRLLGHRAGKPLSAAGLNQICSQTDCFTKKHIVMSPAMNLIDKRWVREQKFDAIVVGSDQVLHPASYRQIEDIYLGFIHGVKKVIYAGSFGTEKWVYTPKQTEHCASLCKEFSGISVREQSGQQFFQTHFSIPAQLVLDPTLLLDKEDYLSTLSQTVHPTGLVTYLLDPNPEKAEMVKLLSLSNGWRVTPAGNEAMENTQLLPSQRVAAPVEDWLVRMAGADFIVTDSFHGTCFAIIFRKNFIAVANKQRGLDRFVTLLTHFSLENRLIYNIQDISNSELLKPIDYIRVEALQKKKREEAWHFLNHSING